MALVTLKQILSESIEKGYAVGAFNAIGPIPIYAEGILSAAEKKGVPVILQIVEPNFADPHCEAYFQYLRNRCRSSSVPVCLHLDHGTCYEAVMQAIHYGCSSVMLDASALPMEENIAMTKKVVEAAHAAGISVEAEIGHVGGKGPVENLKGVEIDTSAFTTVEEAKYFYEQTGVDALAVAFGTVHGVYKGEPHLDLERLSAIREAIDIPIVMHGGSGMDEEKYRQAIEHGVNKINFYTGMALAGENAVKKMLDEAGDTPIPFEFVLDAALDAIQAIVEKHLDIFGTQPLTNL